MNWKRFLLFFTLAFATAIVIYTTNASLIQSEKNYWNAVALGAVMAAEHIWNKKGIFTMKDVLGFGN